MILNRKNIPNYLSSNGLAMADEPVEVMPLKGGNVNRIFLAKTKERNLVLKQALARTQFNKDISLSPNRSLTEYKVMKLWKKRTGSESIPFVYMFDYKEYILVMEAIPEEYEKLTYSLLSGDANLSIAKQLGKFLAKVHNITYHNKKLKKAFRNNEVFRKLKMGLFHYSCYNHLKDENKDEKAKKNVRKTIEKSLMNKVVLIHGDFQPKNILVNNDRFYLVDYEVATLGDPAYDLGNICAQYLLAGIINYPIRKKYYSEIKMILFEYFKHSLLTNIHDKMKMNLVQHFAPVIYGRTFGPANIQFLDEKTKIAISIITENLAFNDTLTLETAFAIVDKYGRELRGNKPLQKKDVEWSRLF